MNRGPSILSTTLTISAMAASFAWSQAMHFMSLPFTGRILAQKGWQLWENVWICMSWAAKMSEAQCHQFLNLPFNILKLNELFFQCNAGCSVLWCGFFYYTCDSCDLRQCYCQECSHARQCSNQSLEGRSSIPWGGKRCNDLRGSILLLWTRPDPLWMVGLTWFNIIFSRKNKANSEKGSWNVRLSHLFAICNNSICRSITLW